jgi:hypothetical protein
LQQGKRKKHCVAAIVASIKVKAKSIARDGLQDK